MPFIAARNLRWRKTTLLTKAGQNVFFPAATCVKAIIAADDTNTDTIAIGPDSHADAKTLSKGDEYTVAGPGSMDQFPLGEWQCYSASANQTLHVTYAVIG